jgi:hypothetical protein
MAMLDEAECLISEGQIIGTLLYVIQSDSKLLSGFPWPVIFKPETTK